jgi:hypothetical protein
MEFKIDETLEQPLELEMITPFGRCQGALGAGETKWRDHGRSRMA